MADPKWKQLGQALRARRTELDLGQKEVIDRLNEQMGERTLRAYESGEQHPSRDRLLKLLTNSFELRSAAPINRYLEVAGYARLTSKEVIQYRRPTADIQPNGTVAVDLPGAP